MIYALIVAALLTPVWCEKASGAPYTAFTSPQLVAIQGYSGGAMEPFISPDGQYLLFNTSNVAPSIPALQVATRITAHSFEYQGALGGEGVNEPGVLSGTPTMDQEGNLYFISPRSYSQTLSTVYTGQFFSGAVTGVHLVTGVSGGTPGVVDFDVAVSPGGSALYVSVGQFGAGSGPTRAVLTLFDKVASGFVVDSHSAKILNAVNRVGMLNYAASVSANGLELFFTRANPANGAKGVPQIYRAVRTNPTRPFGTVQRVAAITGFAEAPALSSDGTTLYYHQLVGSIFEIESVSRP
jgi:hypothetical protein